MKYYISLMSVVVFIAALFIYNPSVNAEGQYEIVWSTIDTGGSTGMGGPYELTGTIGQHDTEISNSEEYTLSSGFWPGKFGCIVNITDLLVLADMWLTTQEELDADIDKSGTVDLEDFAEMANWWYDICPEYWPLK